MKNENITTQEAGRLFTNQLKKDIVCDHFHSLLEDAYVAIDKGLFNDHFCPACVLNHVLEQNRASNSPIKAVEEELSTGGKFKSYEIVYRYDNYDCEGSAPIGKFKIDQMVNDREFVEPVNGKFNISYPFQDVIFECNVTNANSVGEILSQISNAYESVYELANEIGFGYIHGIDELVFEDCIRIHENGTIEFLVGS